MDTEAPLLGQTTMVWRDAAQLKSTQLRMADMDRWTQDTPLPAGRQRETRNNVLNHFAADIPKSTSVVIKYLRLNK